MITSRNLKLPNFQMLLSAETSSNIRLIHAHALLPNIPQREQVRETYLQMTAGHRLTDL